MPFLALAISQIAANHLSSPSGESSKMVPTLDENCRLACLALHSHSRRVGMKRTSAAPQVGQVTPLGHWISTMKARQVSGSVKYRMASWRVLGAARLLSMPRIIG